jgi:hypothetical protein
MIKCDAGPARGSGPFIQGGKCAPPYRNTIRVSKQIGDKQIYFACVWATFLADSLLVGYIILGLGLSLIEGH